MKLFDENGNFVGEFISDSIEQVSDSYKSSFGDGCLAIFIVLSVRFPILLLLIVLWLILKLIWIILKFALRIVWWLVRLPFTLISRKKVPKF